MNREKKLLIRNSPHSNIVSPVKFECRGGVGGKVSTGGKELAVTLYLSHYKLYWYSSNMAAMRS